MYHMSDSKALLIIGAAIVLVFILLILFIVAFFAVFQRNRRLNIEEKKQLRLAFEQELLKARLETQEQTFNQIGEELHDNIGQLMSSTRMLLGITERSMSNPPDTLLVADKTLEKAIVDIRMLSKSLSSEWLTQFNLIENLKAECDRINVAQVFKIDLLAMQSKIPLEANVQVMLFRIVQEAIQNGIKHSGASNMQIDISIEEILTITISDDGKGFEASEKSNAGIGMLNMKKRTLFLGGNILWQSVLGRGTNVIIKIPLHHESKGH